MIEFKITPETLKHIMLCRLDRSMWQTYIETHHCDKKLFLDHPTVSQFRHFMISPTCIFPAVVDGSVHAIIAAAKTFHYSQYPKLELVQDKIVTVYDFQDFKINPKRCVLYYAEKVVPVNDAIYGKKQEDREVAIFRIGVTEHDIFE